MNYPNPSNSSCVCKDCGNILDPNAKFCTSCGRPVSKFNLSLLINVAKVVVAAILCILAIVQVNKGNDVLDDELMERYANHMEECKEARQGCVDAMNRSTGSFYYSYKELVRSYDEMIERDQAKIDELKSKANQFFLYAGLYVAVAAVVVIIPWKRVFVHGVN